MSFPLHYWWAILAGTVSVPMLSGTFWREFSLACTRWAAIHSRSDAKRLRAERVLLIGSPGIEKIAPLLLAQPQAPALEPSTFRTRVRILGLVSAPAPIPDARRSTHGVSWKERRHGPRHAAVWVRVDGTWRRGRLIEWIRDLGHEGWECVIMAEDRQDGPSWQGRYVFDPRSIRARHGDIPPR